MWFNLALSQQKMCTCPLINMLYKYMLLFSGQAFLNMINIINSSLTRSSHSLGTKQWISLKAFIHNSCTYRKGDDFVEQHYRRHVEVEHEVLGTNKYVLVACLNFVWQCSLVIFFLSVFFMNDSILPQSCCDVERSFCLGGMILLAGGYIFIVI